MTTQEPPTISSVSNRCEGLITSQCDGIPFRYIFPIASSCCRGALLLSVSSWLASRDRDRDRGEVGVGWDYVDLESPPLAAEFVGAMYLPAAVAVAPILVAGSYRNQVDPIYGREIEIFSLVIIALVGLLQWYGIGWLLEATAGLSIALHEPCV